MVGGDTPPLRVTISIGLALMGPGQGEPAQSLIDRADVALYEAKAHGRDQVEVAPRTAA